MGGTVPSQKFYDLFPTETWLVVPTDDMKAYPVDDVMLEQLSRMAAKAVAKWASSDGSGDKDKVDWGKYGQAFLYKDTADDPAEDFGSLRAVRIG